MQEEEIKALLIRYQQENCTADEAAFIEQWYAQWNVDAPFSLSAEELEADLLSLAAHHKQVMAGSRLDAVKVLPLHPLKSIKTWAAAAAVIIVAGLSLYFYTKPANTSLTSIDALKNDLPAGRNGATLTLANGRKISLTDALNGQLAEESGASINKTVDGQIVYSLQKGSSAGRNKSTSYNTLSTANGQQYQIVLPDQSKVWLNASSSIKFPATFTSLKDRIVELKGEAYFEVFKDHAHPFIVKTNTQEVQVLGTHFNINSYVDEGVTKTSLLEGSVQITSILWNKTLQRQVLKPGQQAILSGSSLKVSDAEVEHAIDWKNNEFIFNNEPLEIIMRKVARWYDVKVVYEDEQLRNEVFGGTISRFKNVSRVLRMLEMTGSVHFKIEGRRIIVTK
ncbi:FecR family protein [Pedobacter sp. MC2016-14]|uniref:FecR family protein n=1 Tax=Pedobacter sp. MC2016-14 TaxID=2897327 RepID=UPI001E4D989E|nr:FecR family protein [Pedobacter sp. MC2016-14]MCD0490082.1 FecR family protein [Pedobacter sp. MC2016-14]